MDCNTLYYIVHSTLKYCQDLTEYGLLLVLVTLAAIATMQSLASALSNVFSNASSSLSMST